MEHREKRCCANCEWSISPELENEIMEEQGYTEEDLTRPHAGDCAIGEEHGDNFVCSKHIYIGSKDYVIKVLHDNQYFGDGYLITVEVDEEIVKFMKITYKNEMGFPEFVIRGFEKGETDKYNQEFRNIEFDVSKERNLELYNALVKLANELDKRKIYSVNSMEQGKNNLQVLVDENYEEVKLILAKDVYGVKHATNFIDIDLGSHDTCKEYLNFYEFYETLSSVTRKKANETVIKKLLKSQK